MIHISTATFGRSLMVPSRMSGLGDHGSKGIEDFISSHICNHICRGLGLEAPAVMKHTLDKVLHNEINLFGDMEEMEEMTVGRPLASPSDSEEE